MQERAKFNDLEDVRPGTGLRSGAADHVNEAEAMQLLALIHTRVEQALYELMLLETRKAGTKIGAFSVRHLMIYSEIRNDGKVRRARAGLLEKMSIERQNVLWGAEGQAVIYNVFSPVEVLARRQAAGLRTFAKELFNSRLQMLASGQLTERLIEKNNLSPRETQVALKCAEGLTNAEIGKKLFIQEETVKFHLRNIFIKLGVKRRTELMALLFQEERSGGLIC